MPSIEGHALTPRAHRYLTQFCEHLSRLAHGDVPLGQDHGPRPGGQSSHGSGDHAGPPVVHSVEVADDEHARIAFDWGTAELTASPTELTLRVEADDPHELARGRQLLQQRLEALGRRDGLALDWGSPATH